MALEAKSSKHCIIALHVACTDMFGMINGCIQYNKLGP